MSSHNSDDTPPEFSTHENDKTEFVSREADALSEGDSSLFKTQVGSEFRLGPYRIIKELGRGGMGIVYLAEDQDLKRQVALKVLPPTFGTAPAMLARFKREAEVASRLDHPNICGVLRVGETDGKHWIAMRHIVGDGLDEMLRSDESMSRLSSSISSRTVGGMPSELAAKLTTLETVAKALQVAHDAGVVHRDLKPGNIIVNEQREPVVLDFGLAVDLQDGDGVALTQSGDVLGTPYYMAPEQIRGETNRADHRVDIWAMGVMLFEMVTGIRPFDGATRDALYRSILEDEPPQLRKYLPHAPKDLQTIIETALAKQTEKRYASASALAEDLRALMEIRPIHARPVGIVEKTVKMARRRPALATLILALIVILPTIAALLTSRAKDQEKIGAALEQARTQIKSEVTEGRLRAARSALVAGRQIAKESTWQSDLESRIAALEDDEKARTILLDDDSDPQGHMAVKFLKNLVKRRPADTSPHVWLALAYSKQGRQNKAREELAKLPQGKVYLATFNLDSDALAKEEPQSHLRGMFEVMLLSMRGRSLASLQRLERLMESGANQPALAWVAAEQATRIQDFRAALAYASKAKSLMGELTPLQLGRYSVHLRRAGLTDLALKSAEEAHARLPQNPFLRVHLATAYADAGKEEQAVAAYKSLIADEPNLGVAYRNYASVLIEQEEYQAALSISKRSIELDKTDPGVWVNHAAVQQKLGKSKEALASLDQAIRLRPNFPFAMHNRATCLKDLGRLEEAKDAAQAALKLKPDYPECHYTLGAIYLAQGKDAEGLSAFEKAAELQPSLSIVHEGIGTIHLRANRFAKALTSYQAALKSNPTAHMAWVHLTLVYEGLGDLPKALEAGKQAIIFYPTDIQANLNYGSALIHAQQLDEAIHVFQNLLDVAPKEDRIFLMLATLLAAKDTPMATGFLLCLEGRKSPFFQHIQQFTEPLVAGTAGQSEDHILIQVCQLRSEIGSKKLSEEQSKRLKELAERFETLPKGKTSPERASNLAAAYTLARLLEQESAWPGETSSSLKKLLSQEIADRDAAWKQSAAEIKENRDQAARKIRQSAGVPGSKPS